MKKWPNLLLVVEFRQRFKSPSLAIAIAMPWCTLVTKGRTETPGGGAQPPPRGAPRKRSCATMCLERVLVLLRDHVSASCLICYQVVSAWLSAVLFGTLRTAKSWDKTFGVIDSCWDSCSLLRHRGRFPQWGVLVPLGTAVPWGDSPEVQGGPWAPPPCCDNSSETLSDW